MPSTIQARTTHALTACLLLLLVASTASLPYTADAAVALSKPPNNLGLVGYWSFNEGTDTQATDFSGNGNHGTLGTNGGGIPIWTNGKRGRALTFDGATNYVSVPSSPSLNPTSQITISAWVRANSWGGGRRIVEKGDSGNQYRLFDNGGTLSFYLSGVTELDAGPVPSTVVWHHIVGTYNGSTSSVYVDGVLLGSESPGQVVIPASSDNLYIGTRAACSISASNCFDGLIDEVRIYNRGLSATEVARLYQSGAVKLNASSADLDNGSMLANSLVGHWTFDGPDTGTTITDRSDQNNHGYFVGGPTSSAKVIGKLGQALNFVRANSTSVDIASDLMASGDRTACAWVHLSSIANDEFQSIFDTGGFYFLQYYFTGGQYFIFFTSQNSFGDAVLLPSSAPTAGTSLSIGGHVDSPTTYFNGTIDDARVYNRMLSAAEVKQLYKLGTVRITQ